MKSVTPFFFVLLLFTLCSWGKTGYVPTTIFTHKDIWSAENEAKFDPKSITARNSARRNLIQRIAIYYGATEAKGVKKDVPTSLNNGGWVRTLHDNKNQKVQNKINSLEFGTVKFLDSTNTTYGQDLLSKLSNEIKKLKNGEVKEQVNRFYQLLIDKGATNKGTFFQNQTNDFYGIYSQQANSTPPDYTVYSIQAGMLPESIRNLLNEIYGIEPQVRKDAPEAPSPSSRPSKHGAFSVQKNLFT